MDPRPSSPPFLLISASIAFGALLTLALQHYLPPKNNKSSHHPIGDGLLPSPDIRNGIEECIGNTPLIRIKSLSDATGCEILGKAEVCLAPLLCPLLENYFTDSTDGEIVSGAGRID